MKTIVYIFTFSTMLFSNTAFAEDGSHCTGIAENLEAERSIHDPENGLTMYFTPYINRGYEGRPKKLALSIASGKVFCGAKGKNFVSQDSFKYNHVRNSGVSLSSDCIITQYTNNFNRPWINILICAEKNNDSNTDPSYF